MASASVWRLLGLRGILPSNQRPGSAPSTNRQRAFAIRICSIDRQPTSSSCELATTYARHLARDTATFRRFRESRNSRLRGTSPALEVAIEKKTTGACWPWNLSTVPTRAPRGRASARHFTCSLYGATTMMSSRPRGAVTPCASVRFWRALVLELSEIALDLPEPPFEAATRGVQARREATLVQRHREADRTPTSRLVGRGADRLVLDVSRKPFVEVELLLIEVKGDGVGFPLGEELPHDSRFRVGEADEGFLRAPQIERRALPTHRLFEAAHVPVEVP